jgi:serine protease Do
MGLNSYNYSLNNLEAVCMADKDYSFIEESIRPGRHKSIKKYLIKLGAAASFGAVFGIVAAVSFYFINKAMPENGNNDSGQKVSLVVATEEPEDNSAKAKEKDELPDEDEGTYDTEQDDKSDSASHTDSYGDDPQKTALPGSVTGQASDNNPLLGYADMYKEISDYCKDYYSVIVTIAKTSKETDYFENQIDLTSSFYGLILQKDNNTLYLLTDYDNIDGKSTYSLILKDGVSVEATLIGLDEIAGLAVLTADTTQISSNIINELKVASLGSSNGVSMGDLVVAIGNPMGVIGSIGYGVVCNEPKIEYLVDRSIHIYNFGMQNVESGKGIILNTKGNVVGIITHRFSSDMSLCSFMGISDLRITIEQMMNKRSRMGMGIIPRDVGPEYFEDKDVKGGIYVSDMAAGSAAMDAGIMVGDIITAIDGKDVKNVGEYMRLLSAYNSDEEVTVSIYRVYADKNEVRELRVKLEELYG